MSESKEQQLWDACTSSDLELVKRLASDSAVNVNWGDSEYDRTPFFRACGQGHVSVVQFLLKHPQVDVNKPNKDGATPFYIACQKGHKEVAALLLANTRVGVTQPMNAGRTPFYVACQQGHKEVVALLLSDTRIDVNKPENNGFTPFHMSSGEGQQGSGAATPG